MERKILFVTPALALIMVLGTFISLAGADPTKANNPLILIVDHVSVYWNSNDGVKGEINIEIRRGDKPPTVYLNYNVTKKVGSTNSDYQKGSGYIPRKDITGNVHKSISVDVDTCDVEGFRIMDGHCGLINVQWETEPSNWTTVKHGKPGEQGYFITKYGPVEEVTGSILGYEIYGTFSGNAMQEIFFIRNP